MNAKSGFAFFKENTNNIFLYFKQTNTNNVALLLKRPLTWTTINVQLGTPPYLSSFNITESCTYEIITASLLQSKNTCFDYS